MIRNFTEIGESLEISGTHENNFAKFEMNTDLILGYKGVTIPEDKDFTD